MVWPFDTYFLNLVNFGPEGGPMITCSDMHHSFTDALVINHTLENLCMIVFFSCNDLVFTVVTPIVTDRVAWPLSRFVIVVSPAKTADLI